MKNKKRYFLVSWRGAKNTGLTSFMTDGCYINQDKTRDAIEDRNSVSPIVITNIIELSENDFNDFYEG